MKLLCCAALLLAHASYACINIKGVSIDGTYNMVIDEFQIDFLRARMNSQARDRYKYVNSKTRPLTKPHAEDEKLAVNNILEGKFEEAIEKLLAIEAADPGDYSTAANLGTAYELVGDNANALHWITTGMERNARSHFGTEWLHKKILEAKIEMESDPDYLKTHHILLFSEENVRVPANQFKFEYDDRVFQGEELREALHYQLGERLLFVKPKDAVVADLLYSFAILEANTRVLEPAVELLMLSKEYGYHDQMSIDARIAQYQNTIKWTWKIETKDKVALGLMTIAILCLLMIILLKRRSSAKEADAV